MDPKTGGVEASASWPTYDPTQFVKGMTDKEYKQRFRNAVLGRSALRPGDPGRVRAGVDVQAVHRARRPEGGCGRSGLRDRLPRAMGVPPGPGPPVQQLVHVRPGLHVDPRGPPGLVRHGLLPVGRRVLRSLAVQPAGRRLRAPAARPAGVRLRPPARPRRPEPVGRVHPHRRVEGAAVQAGPEELPVRVAAGRRHPHVDRPGLRADEPDADGDGVLRHRERRPAVRAPPGRADPDLRRQARPQDRVELPRPAVLAAGDRPDPGGPAAGGGAGERHGLGGVRRVPTLAGAGDGQDRHRRAARVHDRRRSDPEPGHLVVRRHRRPAGRPARDRRDGGAGWTRLHDGGTDRAVDHRGHVQAGQDRRGRDGATD